ncbi:hypothetical protein J6590_105556, partial [Homalodisca vitripennis]
THQERILISRFCFKWESINRPAIAIQNVLKEHILDNVPMCIIPDIPDGLRKELHDLQILGVSARAVKNLMECCTPNQMEVAKGNVTSRHGIRMMHSRTGRCPVSTSI